MELSSFRVEVRSYTSAKKGLPIRTAAFLQCPAARITGSPPPRHSQIHGNLAAKITPDPHQAARRDLLVSLYFRIPKDKGNSNCYYTVMTVVAVVTERRRAAVYCLVLQVQPVAHPPYALYGLWASNGFTFHSSDTWESQCHNVVRTQTTRTGCVRPDQSKSRPVVGGSCQSVGICHARIILLICRKILLRIFSKYAFLASKRS